MVTLAALRRELGLSPPAEDRAVADLNDALSGCPELAGREVICAAGALAAREVSPGQHGSSVPLLLGALRDAAMGQRPEQALVTLVCTWTGGLAEVRSSWGDLVASAGRAAGERVTLRLVHRERHVGSLALAVPPRWRWLAEVVAEYALLARLQSAAAGAARRRVGERVLEAILSGGEEHALGQAPFAVAVAAVSNLPQGGTAGLTAREDALDVLAAVGEGYLTERCLSGYSTVLGGRAVWLWSTIHLPTEGRELHAALLASTEQDVRLGVSARHALPGRGAVPSAYREAQQALAATRSRRGYTPFQEMDPLFALLAEGRLDALRAQVAAQLAGKGDERVVQTLRAYLAHTGTLEELAHTLGIHVNTLRARLRRAEDALGGKLSDPALLGRLYLALAAAGPAG